MAMVLASNSPRRRELLGLITQDFSVQPSALDERHITAATPAALALALAEAKCRDVAAQRTEDTVIGCDTVVDCDGEVFGKPHSEGDACRMLRALSGRVHQVHTGVCVSRGGRVLSAVETTSVHFAPIPEGELLAYIRTTEPYDKAGAYAIQGKAALWCEGIEGCYYNVMGLPVHRLAELLRELG
ncbi:MAG: Maf family protein [Gemmiger sp.]